MKRLFWLFLVVMALLPLSMQARTCSKCGGSGQMKVFHSLSTYGVSNKKHQCPICKEWVPVGEAHYDTCDRCGGTGQVETVMDRRNAERSAKLEDEANEGLSHLTPAELSQFQALQELLKGRKERVECTACSATGRCPQCNGSGWAGGRECFVCSMTGKCIGCYGTGTARWNTVYPTEEEKQEIMGRMAALVSNAVRREQGSNQMPDNDLKDNLAVDDEDMEEDASEDTEETVAPQEEEDDDIYGVIGLAAIVGFIYWLFRKNRRKGNNKQVNDYSSTNSHFAGTTGPSIKRFCPNCGTKLSGSGRFCKNCGCEL